MGNFHNLGNEEILFVFFKNKIMFDELNYIIDNKLIEYVVDKKDNKVISEFIQLTDSEIEEIKNSFDYQYCVKVHNALKDIIELIKESFPELYDKFQTSANQDILDVRLDSEEDYPNLS